LEYSGPPRVTGIGIADGALDNTFAHELGHMILNGGGMSLHTTDNGDPNRRNIMHEINSNRTFAQIGPVGDRDIFTAEQITRAFNPPDNGMPNTNNAGQVQQTAAADDHRYANRVDWNFVVDHRALQTLNTETAMPDNHAGLDTLFWSIDAVATGPGDDSTHSSSALGTFADLGNFAGQSFRFADVFSLSLRYSDYDQNAAGAFSLKQSALDYNVFFRAADGTVMPGTPLLSFELGWTANTNADNFLTRWVAPFNATGIFVEANNAAGRHDGIAQIDAIIVSQINLPGDYNLDNVVDAADYVVWRKNLGSGTSLPNDDTDGVGQDDYTR
jgi:hypothetical protein